jgi:hypothetical protein
VLGVPGRASALTDVQVSAALEQDSAYLGESFFFHVKVLGGVKIGEPDISKVADFDIRELPLAWVRDRLGSRLKKFNLDEGTGYLYRLIATKTGTLSIPSLPVEVDGRTYMTPLLRVRVLTPPPSNDYILSLTLGKRKVYVGEQVTLTAVWLYREAASFYSVRIPILKSDSFEMVGDSNALPARPVFGADGWPGKQSTVVRDGEVYHVVTFEQVLRAKQPGSYDFAPGTVQIWVPPEGDQSSQPDWRARWNYRSTVVGSEPLSIRVLPLPLAGRPANYSGLVAEGIRVSAAVTPDTMNVGDPVTLTVSLSGPPALDSAELPPLESLGDLEKDFTLRGGALKSQVAGTAKSFSQTLRVKSEAVHDLPSLSVPYFDTRSGTYKLAVTRPVPITVRPTKIVTAADVEGGSVPAAAPAGPRAVRAWEQGILFNYTGTGELLASQSPGLSSSVRGPALPVVLGVPLLVLVAALLAALRRAAARRPVLEAAGAAPGGPPSLETLADPGAVSAAPGAGGPLDALRDSIAARLALQPGRATWPDIKGELPRHGVGDGLLRELESLFGCREQGSFGGGLGGCAEDEQELTLRVSRAAAELARQFQ